MNTALLLRYRRWVVAAGLGIVACCAIAAALRLRNRRCRSSRRASAAPASRPRTKAGTRMPTAASACCSATTTGTPRRALDIPVGPNNRVEPGGPDQGQPTHFEIGRQWGVFVVKVPKDFGTKAITWTIVVERRDAVDSVHPEQGISDQPVQGTGHGQPAAGARLFTGRREGDRSADRRWPHSFTGTVKQPIAINVWVEDPKAPGEAEGAARPRVRPCQGRDRLAPQVPRTRESDLRQGAHPGRQAGRDDQRRRRPSTRRASTCCACRPTTNRARAAPAFSAAGPIPT